MCIFQPLKSEDEITVCVDGVNYLLVTSDRRKPIVLPKIQETRSIGDYRKQ